MRSVALFILCSLIFYLVYFVMNDKLIHTEKETIIRYKEVPKKLLDEQYTFDNNNYYDKLVEQPSKSIMNRIKVAQSDT